MVSLSFSDCTLSFTARPGPTPFSEFHSSPKPSLTLNPELHEVLLSQTTPQLLCLVFFKALHITVQGGTRWEFKRRYYRLTLNKGEVTFEVPVKTMWLARRAVALKAVQAFSPTLVQEWLQRYRKLGNALKEYLCTC